MQVVVITYNKTIWYSFGIITYNKERCIIGNYQIKSDCITYYYMTIDLHKAIGKLPIIPKRGFVLPNMNYCGAYNPLDKQLIYGNILRYMQNPTGKTDEICAQYDVDYDLSKSLKDKHLADEKMINAINELPYDQQ